MQRKLDDLLKDWLKDAEISAPAQPRQKTAQCLDLAGLERYLVGRKLDEKDRIHAIECPYCRRMILTALDEIPVTQWARVVVRRAKEATLDGVRGKVGEIKKALTIPETALGYLGAEIATLRGAGARPLRPLQIGIRRHNLAVVIWARPAGAQYEVTFCLRVYPEPTTKRFVRLENRPLWILQDNEMREAKETNSDGVARFLLDEGEYVVRLADVPDISLELIIPEMKSGDTNA